MLSAKTPYTIILFLTCCFCRAQLPGFDIYLMDILGDSNKFIITTPINITSRIGYDNQPAFTPDGKEVLFTSVRENDQADIYKYSIKEHTTQQITRTAYSEFSPEVTPDGKAISIVSLENDKDSTQRMWLYNLDGSSPRPMMDDIKQIGYYGRIDEKNIALWLLPDPPTLSVTNISKQLYVNVDYNIGRCIKKIPGESAMSYILKQSDSIWLLCKLEIPSNKKTVITDLPAVSEDYAWRKSGHLFMARGTELYFFDYHNTAKWIKFEDVQRFGIKKIYRLAFSPDGKKLAFVAEEN